MVDKRFAFRVGLVEVFSDFENDGYEYVSWLTSRCKCGWKGTMRTNEEYPSREAREAAMRTEAEEHMRTEHPDVQLEA